MPFFDPITHKRLKRFKELKRAYFSLWLLILLYVISLFSEFICNSKPIYLRFEGHSYFPIFQFYPESDFLPDGADTRPDYRQLAENPIFADNSENYMIFPPIRFDPYESIDAAAIDLANHVEVRFKREPLIASVDLLPNNHVARSVQFGAFVDRSDWEAVGFDFSKYIPMSDDLKAAIRLRFDNKQASGFSKTFTDLYGKSVTVSLAAYRPRSSAPLTVRLRLHEAESTQTQKKASHSRKL